jgi:hypothetical protein
LHGMSDCTVALRNEAQGQAAMAEEKQHDG